MTIGEIIEFYFARYNYLLIGIEMWGGIPGKYHCVNKEQYNNIFGAWNDRTVIKTVFNTYNMNYATGECIKRDLPLLYICYANNE
jgi:hypothetical protein